MESLLFSVARIVRKMSPLAPESELEIAGREFAHRVLVRRKSHESYRGGYCQGQNLVKATKFTNEANKATKLTELK